MDPEFAAIQEEQIREAVSRREYGIKEQASIASRAASIANGAAQSNDFETAAQKFQLAADLCRDAHEQCQAWLREYQARRIA